MATSQALKSLQNRFGEKILKVREKNEHRFYVRVPPEEVCEMAMHLYRECEWRLATITGVDTRSGIELLYLFLIAPEHRFLTLRALVTKPEAAIDSLGRLLPAAEWAEREAGEILGVTFRDHPHPHRLILPDDWPEGVYPSRRDYDMSQHQRPYEAKGSGQEGA
ncbi:MAG: NADH-quinone oxidoreductase subunit C [Planctomycetota bacterium]